MEGVTIISFSKEYHTESTTQNQHDNDLVIFFLALFDTEESFYNYIIQIYKYLLTFF